MKKQLLAPVLLSLLATSPAFAQSNSTLCATRESSLNFLLNDQVRTDSNMYKTGEWPAEVTTGGVPRDLHILKKGPLEDPDAFTVASVQNVLSEIYMKYKKDPRIPHAMSVAREAMKRYRTDNGSYNFWPANPKGGKNGHLPVSSFTIGAVDGLVDIPADADDTAVVYLSLLDDEKILGLDRSTGDTSSILNFPIESLYSKYLDHGIRAPSPVNIVHGEVETGAYLTWLQHDPLIPIISSAFFPQSAGPRVVLGKNNVDCVVNANVLRTLTRFGKTDAPGYDSACRLITESAKHGDYNSCGYYYPDTYWLHFAVARAYQDGASCLQEAVDLNLKNLLSTQLPDGGWHNDVIKNDDVLASALALSALVKTGDPSDPIQVAAVKKGLNHLLAVSQTNEAKNSYWSGGVFFSAGFPARKGVLWTSNSFTTALVTQILFESERWLPRELQCMN